jgi:hypothetical protein
MQRIIKSPQFAALFRTEKWSKFAAVMLWLDAMANMQIYRRLYLGAGGRRRTAVKKIHR